MRFAMASPLTHPPARLSSPFPADPAHALATRWLPAVFAVGPLLALVWLLVHPSEGVDQRLFVGAVVLGWATSVAVLTGALDVGSPRILHGVVATGAILVSLCIAADARQGFNLMYLWIVPLAFVLFGLRAALAHCAVAA